MEGIGHANFSYCTSIETPSFLDFHIPTTNILPLLEKVTGVPQCWPTSPNNIKSFLHYHLEYRSVLF